MKKVKRNLSIMWECYPNEMKMLIAYTIIVLAFTILMSFLITPWYLVLNVIYPTLFLATYRNISKLIDESLINKEKLNRYTNLLNNFNRTE